MSGRAWRALAAYLVITLIVTWPLAAGLGRDVAWDLGDSLLNMWILAWDMEQFRAILGGDLSRFASFFDANIFHPAPLTLAYSEHLVPQALQVFPIYLVTRNPILCYNLLFLSTFVLSGFGMYLFVRELTRNEAAAFIAGLVFAFTPYRLPQSSHIQVLSSQWMPFALYGLHRYFDTRRVRALAGATAAIVVQGLSCGYYLLYFTPFAAAYALFEVWRRRLWRDRVLWLQASLAAAGAAIVVLPFLLPYAAIRSSQGMTRPLAEITGYSADVYSYVSAFTGMRFWGEQMQAFPKAEGELFPGMVPVLLALIGLAAWRTPERQRLTWPARLFAGLAALHLIAALATVIERRIVVDLWLFTLQMSDVNQLLIRAAVAVAILLWISPEARRRTRVFMAGPGFFLVALAAAVWLSLGPAPQALGRPVNIAAPYRFLVEQVPGYEGLRVPARLAMVSILMLAVLSGFGAAVVMRGRPARAALPIIAVLVLLEGTMTPFWVNVTGASPGVAAAEPRVYRPARAPAVYQEFARQPGEAVLAELPIGTTDYDLRAVYYSTAHWRPVVNGYSGFAPRHYGALVFALNDLPRHPELSLMALRQAGATHVIVHEAAFLRGEGPATSGALRAAGAVELYRSGSDVLFSLNGS